MFASACHHSEYHHETRSYTQFPSQPIMITFRGLDASRFPKFCGVKKGGWVQIHFDANGVNKGANETGIKRMRKIIEIAGDALIWETPALNSYKTLADFLSAI